MPSAIGRRVAAVQHEDVPVRVGEVRHVADARVERLAGEDDALRLELAPRRLDIGDAQRDRRRVWTSVLLPDVGRIEQVEGDVLAELELGPLALADLLELERVAVEGRR